MTEGKNTYIMAQPSFLRDSKGNYILPKTTTGLVTDSDGKSVETILETYSQKIKDIDIIKGELNLLERKYLTLNAKIDYVNAVQDLRNEIEKQIGDNGISDDVLGTVNRAFDAYKDVDEDLIDIVDERSTNNANQIKKIESKISDIDKDIAQIPKIGENKTEINANKKAIESMDQRLKTIETEYKQLLDTSLLTIIDIFDFACGLDSTAQYSDIDRVVEICIYLYTNGKIDINDLPTNSRELLIKFYGQAVYFHSLLFEKVPEGIASEVSDYIDDIKTTLEIQKFLNR